MNLYLLSQEILNGYDTYDSAVVAARSEKDARRIHPSESVTHTEDGKWMGTNIDGDTYEREFGEWVVFADIDEINVEYLGKTTKNRGVILASFNAG